MFSGDLSPFISWALKPRSEGREKRKTKLGEDFLVKNPVFYFLQSSKNFGQEKKVDGNTVILVEFGGILPLVSRKKTNRCETSRLTPPDSSTTRGNRRAPTRWAERKAAGEAALNMAIFWYLPVKFLLVTNAGTQQLPPSHHQT